MKIVNSRFQFRIPTARQSGGLLVGAKTKSVLVSAGDTESVDAPLSVAVEAVRTPAKTARITPNLIQTNGSRTTRCTNDSKPATPTFSGEPSETFPDPTGAATEAADASGGESEKRDPHCVDGRAAGRYFRNRPTSRSGRSALFAS